MQQITQLVKMADQIALNLGAGHDHEAAARNTADHMRRYWTPAMCRQLTEFWRQGGMVAPVVASALTALAQADHRGS